MARLKLRNNEKRNLNPCLVMSNASFNDFFKWYRDRIKNLIPEIDEAKYELDIERELSKRGLHAHTRSKPISIIRRGVIDYDEKAIGIEVNFGLFVEGKFRLSEWEGFYEDLVYLDYSKCWQRYNKDSEYNTSNIAIIGVKESFEVASTSSRFSDKFVRFMNDDGRKWGIEGMVTDYVERVIEGLKELSYEIRPELEKRSAFLHRGIFG